MSYENNGDEWEEEEGANLDLQMLRDALVAELQAINQYEENVDMIDDEEAQEMLLHIASEEKEHVAELVKMIKKLDPEQAEKLDKIGT
ncbi:MAG: hypothetical protein HYX87_00215 [Chloroflexi bacterium]|nr:hypothetical protein [Chloroflexota bacterium]